MGVTPNNSQYRPKNSNSLNHLIFQYVLGIFIFRFNLLNKIVPLFIGMKRKYMPRPRNDVLQEIRRVGLSLQDIADELGEPLGSTKNRLYGYMVLDNKMRRKILARIKYEGIKNVFATPTCSSRDVVLDNKGRFLPVRQETFVMNKGKVE